MSALRLFGYICAALFIQGAAGAALFFWRRRSLNASTVQAEKPTVVTTSGAAWTGWREFRVSARNYEDAAKTQCSFSLQPVDGTPLPPFKPGQYLTFSLEGVGSGGTGSAGDRSLTRCYSLSDRPDPLNYRITIKRMQPPAGRTDLPPGLASSHFLESVREGDIVKVRAPAGRFFIDPDARVPAVFIAGGIGITPIMSMLRWCLTEQPGRTLHLYYGVRNGADQAFRGLLQEMADDFPAFWLHLAYSCPGAGDVLGRDYQHFGRIDMALLRNSLPPGRHQFYVCGPPAMMQSMVPALREEGISAKDIHFESFGPVSFRPVSPDANTPQPDDRTVFEVRLTRSGRTLVWDGQDASLLDFAERHGVLVDSGCRSGSCGSCETGLLSGTIHNADKPDYEIAGGSCLLCISTPQSALVLEA